MKILVATSDVPFVEGGHRVIARALVNALRESGHEAEILTTPQNRFGRQFSAYLATRLIDVELTGTAEAVDRLISLRYPSYALKHPHHTCWLNHRMREYYDLWPQWTRQLSWKGKIKESVRRSLIRRADSHYLRKNVQRVLVQSRTVQQSLLQWGNIQSQVLYPPPPQRPYRTDGYGDFVLSPSRLSPLKRIPMLIEALARTSVVRAVVIGEGPEKEKIMALIRQYNLENRIEMLGHVTEDQMVDLYARCRAIYYAPVNEDYGLATLEAFRSRKPVITATDSGGPTELVQDGINGYVILPESSELATRLEKLCEDSSLAETMGNAGFAFANDFTWPKTVSRLLET